MTNISNKKNFDEWNEDKKVIHSEKEPIYFKENDIWWCKLGLNIGDEQDGKGQNFSRPILIIKKFNQFVFWAVPLSTKLKKNKYYIPCDSSNGETRAAIISQLRLISVKRLTDKTSIAEEVSVLKIKKAIKDLL
jgi:mRNA interferase MazF